MKKIPKKLLDECIKAHKEYWKPSVGHFASFYKADYLTANLADEMNISPYALNAFFTGIFHTHGIYPDAENDEIYCALRTLGWEPTE